MWKIGMFTGGKFFTMLQPLQYKPLGYAFINLTDNM